ncbi:MAG: hypothetical protein ACI4V4_01240 [Eubacterium sp.]
MKRRIINSANASMDLSNKSEFTPRDLVTVLQGIDELQHCDIILRDNLDGTYNLFVGDSKYKIIDSAQTNI